MRSESWVEVANFVPMKVAILGFCQGVRVTSTTISRMPS
jgi:dienelactone hydrolase